MHVLSLLKTIGVLCELKLGRYMYKNVQYSAFNINTMSCMEMYQQSFGRIQCVAMDLTLLI